jgi:hypothetical protein
MDRFQDGNARLTWNQSPRCFPAAFSWSRFIFHAARLAESQAKASRNWRTSTRWTTCTKVDTFNTVMASVSVRLAMSSCSLTASGLPRPRSFTSCVQNTIPPSRHKNEQPREMVSSRSCPAYEKGSCLECSSSASWMPSMALRAWTPGPHCSSITTTSTIPTLRAVITSSHQKNLRS